MAEIRRAEARDLERIVALLEQFPADPELPSVDWQDARRAFPELLEGERGVIFVSEVDGELAGLVALSFTCALRFGGDYALIEDFIVDGAFRGKGIANPLSRRRGAGAVERSR